MIEQMKLSNVHPYSRDEIPTSTIEVLLSTHALLGSQLLSCQIRKKKNLLLATLWTTFEKHQLNCRSKQHSQGFILQPRLGFSFT